MSTCGSSLHVCPEKSSPILLTLWEHILTDAMLWAVPGHCQENHNLSKSKIKAENEPSVSMDDHKAVPETMPCPSSVGWCRCSHGEHPVHVTSTALFCWEKQARRGRVRANTSTPAQPHQADSWQQGRNRGLILPLAIQAQIRSSFNEIGGTAWM